MNHTDSSEHLRRRFLSLGVGELAASAAFTVATLSVLPGLSTSDATITIAAMFVLLAVLIPAGVYWLVARRWVVVGSMPRALAYLYVVVGLLDVLLVSGLVVWIVLTPPNEPIAWMAVAGMGLLSILELVNYGVWRLAYPPMRWAREVRRRRTPRLAADVRATLEG